MGKSRGSAMAMEFVRTRIRITPVSPSMEVIAIRAERAVHLFRKRFLQVSRRFSTWANRIGRLTNSTITKHATVIMRERERAKLAAANEKRWAFYKIEASIATKKKYREKAAVEMSNHQRATDVHGLEQGTVFKGTHWKSCKTLVNIN